MAPQWELAGIGFLAIGFGLVMLVVLVLVVVYHIKLLFGKLQRWLR